MSQNSLGRIVNLVLTCVLVAISVFHLFSALFLDMQPYAQTHFVLALLLTAGILLHPFRGKPSASRSIWSFLPDLVCILIIIGIQVYVFSDFWGFIERGARSNVADRVVGTLGFLMVLELSRRFLGWPITIVAAFLLAQVVLGPHMPSIFYGPPISWKALVEIVYMSDTGLYGMPIGIMTSYLIIFFIFVAFLQVTKAGDFFIDLAKAVAGRYSGGPAKVAVVASAALGTITGSPMANVVGTGCVTIPLMKSIGYKPEFAAAVEACSSTGAQYMPPVMGITAFLIAQFLGVPYYKVMIATLIPCILFYIAIFTSVHFEAKKTGLQGLPKSELPSLVGTFRWGGILLVPIAVLTLLMFRAYSLETTALWAIVTLFILSFLQKRTRLNAKSLFETLELGGRMSVGPGIACAVCGIIIGVFSLTGLGDKLNHLIISASYGYTWLALIWTGVASILLGMAVTTPVIYIIMLVSTIPALVGMGVNLLAAHMFAFYMGVMSNITPPVALASYTAAGIAETSPMRTCWQAMKIGSVAWLVPFLFVFSPELLGVGAIGDIILRSVTGIIGVAFIAAGTIGWLTHEANFLERLAFAIGGVMLLFPIPLMELASLILLVPALFSHFRSRVALGKGNAKI